MKNICFLLMLLFISMPALAADPLAKGGKIPSVAALENQDGESLKLYDLYGEKGMTLVFIRSAGWCPYCQKQLINLSKSAADFEKSGYPLVGLSYDNAEILKKFDAKHDIAFPLLSDPASEVIRAFGIMDETYAKGTFAYGVPKPAIYVINDKGIVEKIFKEASYKDRPDISSILKEIKPAPVVNLGEEFPEDPTNEGVMQVMEVMEETVERIETPILDAPASDAAVDAAIEINEATMEQSLDALDMDIPAESDIITQPISEEKATDIIQPIVENPDTEPLTSEIVIPDMDMPAVKDPLE